MLEKGRGREGGKKKRNHVCECMYLQLCTRWDNGGWFLKLVIGLLVCTQGLCEAISDELTRGKMSKSVNV